MNYNECVICGASLADRRWGAETCSDICRQRKSRHIRGLARKAHQANTLVYNLAVEAHQGTHQNQAIHAINLVRDYVNKVHAELLNLTVDQPTGGNNA